MIAPLASILLAALTPDAPLYPPSDGAAPDPEYDACIAGLAQDVEKGRAAASQWYADGGGAPALHCLAVADLAAGFAKLSAIHLEELAARPDAGDELVRARILSQAAQAWLEAQEPQLAEKAIDAAFAAAPDAGELYLIQAAVKFAQNEMQATVDAVTAAGARGVASPEGYVLRGRALHALARNREAAEDVVAALKLDPLNVDALVLRGDLYQAGVEIKAHYNRPADSGR